MLFESVIGQLNLEGIRTVHMMRRGQPASILDLVT